MRIAVIACSPYAQCQKLTELSSVETDVDLLGQRLAEPDAGFVVHSFRAERGLAEAVDQVLAEASEPVDELLFYFAGYAVLNDERGPALLLDGERLSAFSLKRLKRVLAERARSSLAVIDALQRASDQPIVRMPTLGGSLPLSIISETLDQPTITVPIANYDNNQHAENENIRLQNLWDGIEIYASLMTMRFP